MNLRMHPHTRRFALGLGLASIGLVFSTAVALAGFGATSTNTGNTAGLDILAPPTGVATTHDGNHTANPQTIVLSWTASSSTEATGYLVQRAVDGASACGTFTTIATVNPIGTGTVTYSDTTAVYDTQYCYQVLTYLSGTSWTRSSSPSNVALSLSPTSATDTTGNGEVLNGVFRQSAASTWVVGNGGVILMGSTTNGITTWSAETSGTTSNLFGVTFVSGTEGWAVGAGGTILHTTTAGSSWAPQASGTAADLMAVSGAASDHVWAVGSGGTILFFNGSTWGTQSSGTTNTLFSVSAVKGTSNTFRAWAVGAGGRVEQTCDGTTPVWTAETSTTTNDLLGAWFISTTTGWAVGKSGTIIVTSNAACTGSTGSASWGGQVSGTSQDLFSVSSSTGDVWAAGTGAALVTNANQGTGTSPTPTPWSVGSAPASFKYDLRAIGGFDGCKFIAAGEAAGVLDIESSSSTCSGAAWAQDSLLGLIGTSAYSLTTSDLSRLAAMGDGLPLYESRDGVPSSFAATCSSTSSKWIKLQFSPGFLDSSAISTVLVTTTYQAAAGGGTMHAELLVSTDGGATWPSAVALNDPTTSSQTVTSDISTTVNTTAKVSGLQLCFQATGTTAVPMLLDLVHVDVN